MPLPPSHEENITASSAASIKKLILFIPVVFITQRYSIILTTGGCCIFRQSDVGRCGAEGLLGQVGRREGPISACDVDSSPARTASRGYCPTSLWRKDRPFDKHPAGPTEGGRLLLLRGLFLARRSKTGARRRAGMPAYAGPTGKSTGITARRKLRPGHKKKPSETI